MIAGAARPEELEAIPVADGFVWHPVRRRFDVRAFGINMYSSEGVGRQIVEEHNESSGHEEIYVVVRGRATFTVGEDTVDAPAGTIVFLRDPTVTRSAVAETDNALVLAVGGFPDKPFEVSPWESFFYAIPYTRTERWAEALEILHDGLEEHPDSAAMLYNLACMEARAGKPLDALLHLQEAVRLRPELAEVARTDSDFAAIRAEPGFPA